VAATSPDEDAAALCGYIHDGVVEPGLAHVFDDSGATPSDDLR